MPIYDNDGTTTFEISTLYDNNGSTNYQIGTVYDNDGTTNHLIYNSEQEIYWNGVYTLPMVTTVVADMNIASVTDNGVYVTLRAKGRYGTAGSHVIWWTQNAIDLTPYNTVSFTVSGSAINGQGYLDCADGCHMVGIASNTYTRNSLAGYTRYVNLNRPGTNIPNTQADGIYRTINMNISDLNGSYRVGVAASAYILYDFTVTCNVARIRIT